MAELKIGANFVGLKKIGQSLEQMFGKAQKLKIDTSMLDVVDNKIKRYRKEIQKINDEVERIGSKSKNERTTDDIKREKMLSSQKADFEKRIMNEEISRDNINFKLEKQKKLMDDIEKKDTKSRTLSTAMGFAGAAGTMAMGYLAMQYQTHAEGRKLGVWSGRSGASKEDYLDSVKNSGSFAGYSRVDSIRLGEKLARATGSATANDVRNVQGIARATGADTDQLVDVASSMRKSGMGTSKMYDMYLDAMTTGIEKSRLPEFMQISAKYLEDISKNGIGKSSDTNLLARITSNSEMYRNNPEAAMSAIDSVNKSLQGQSLFQKTVRTETFKRMASQSGKKLDSMDLITLGNMPNINTAVEEYAGMVYGKGNYGDKQRTEIMNQLIPGLGQTSASMMGLTKGQKGYDIAAAQGMTSGDVIKQRELDKSFTSEALFADSFSGINKKFNENEFQKTLIEADKGVDAASENVINALKDAGDSIGRAIGKGITSYMESTFFDKVSQVITRSTMSQPLGDPLYDAAKDFLGFGK